MSRLSARDLTRVCTGLRALYSCRDLRQVPQQILSFLADLVPGDCTSYNEFDPTNPNHVVAFTRPLMPEILARVPAFEAHLSEHPLISRYRQTGDGSPYKTTDFVSCRQFRALGIYRDFFGPVGIGFQIGGFFSVRPHLEIGLAINRAKVDFSERDRAVLALIFPHLAQAYQNAAAFTACQESGRLVSEALECANEALIILASDGRVTCLTPNAVRLLGRYFPGQGCTWGSLPETLQRWVRQQSAFIISERASGQQLLPLRLTRPDSRLTIRLSLCHSGEVRLLLAEEATVRSVAHRRALRLTEREAEVLHWIGEGKTNPEIGTILAVSPRTIHKHVEHILAKLGVENRSAAVRVASELK